jgi:poly [ADP-ribose] polymerase 10/14/15
MLGVEAVVQAYDPQTDTVGGGQRVSSSASSTTEPQYRSLWYFKEDQSRVASHNQHDLFQPGNFVKYAGSVCAEMEEQWEKFRNQSGPAKHLINLTDRIASTGTEQKAFGAESGYDYEIDFSSNPMTQKNLKSGYKREVLRREIPITLPAAPDLPAVVPQTTVKSSKTSKSVVATKAGGKPTDLNGDLLVLHVGQLVQFSEKRDGWGFGCIIFDEEDARPVIDVEGVSQTSGWFPKSCTEMPTAQQLEKLQSVMGGEGAKALEIPKYWEQVTDPAKAELFLLRDGPEKQKVVNAFMASLASGKVQVVSVERVENVALWQSYAVKRQTMQTTIADGKSVEREWLFHGTTDDIVPKIIQQGFNRSFCGRNATAYGKGVYFARDSSYSTSATYSKPDMSGVQRMFVCRVAVGEYCQGKRDLLTPDFKDSAKHLLYDSTVDNVRDPSIYVTYHDGQAYPEYLVKFKQ